MMENIFPNIPEFPKYPTLPAKMTFLVIIGRCKYIRIDLFLAYPLFLCGLLCCPNRQSKSMKRSPEIKRQIVLYDLSHLEYFGVTRRQRKFLYPIKFTFRIPRTALHMKMLSAVCKSLTDNIFSEAAGVFSRKCRR